MWPRRHDALPHPDGDFNRGPYILPASFIEPTNAGMEAREGKIRKNVAARSRLTMNSFLIRMVTICSSPGRVASDSSRRDCIMSTARAGTEWQMFSLQKSWMAVR